jgi:Arm DNA-binding domain
VALQAPQRLPYSEIAMGCSFRINRHGYLGFRLFWNGIESYEGTKLRDTSTNRAKVEARAQVINEEIASGRFDYLRWFPEGNAAWRFRQPQAQEPRQLITVKDFFRRWDHAAKEGEAQGAAVGSKYAGVVSAKWIINRASYIRNHVLPYIGEKRLD